MEKMMNLLLPAELANLVTSQFAMDQTEPKEFTAQLLLFSEEIFQSALD